MDSTELPNDTVDAAPPAFVTLKIYGNPAQTNAQTIIVGKVDATGRSITSLETVTKGIRFLNTKRSDAIFSANFELGKCVYCGSTATDADHLRSLVKNERPSGYFHRPDNVVRSCGRCNQSKGGNDWRTWINRTAPGSPASHKVADIELKISRLASLAGKIGPTYGEPAIKFREAVGSDLWDNYWARVEVIRQQLIEADKCAELIRSRLAKVFSG